MEGRVAEGAAKPLSAETTRPCPSPSEKPCEAALCSEVGRLGAGARGVSIGTLPESADDASSGSAGWRRGSDGASTARGVETSDSCLSDVRRDTLGEPSMEVGGVMYCSAAPCSVVWLPASLSARFSRSRARCSPECSLSRPSNERGEELPVVLAACSLDSRLSGRVAAVLVLDDGRSASCEPSLAELAAE